MILSSLAVGFLTVALLVLNSPPVVAQPVSDQGMRINTRLTKPQANRPAVKPNARTTGVPRGTVLKVHHGNLVVKKAGTRLDALDIHGFVIIKAPDVTISRSIIRGGRHPHHAIGLVTNYGYPRLLIQDSLLQAAFPSVYVDGIKGSDFTARRVHVIGNVDSIKIQGNNVRIERSLLENTRLVPVGSLPARRPHA